MATQARNRGSPTAATSPAVWDSCADQRRHLAVQERVLERQQDGELVVGADARPAELEDAVVLVKFRVGPVLAGDGVQQADATVTR